MVDPDGIFLEGLITQSEWLINDRAVRVDIGEKVFACLAASCFLVLAVFVFVALSGIVEPIDHESFVDLCSQAPAKDIKKHLERGADINLENSMGITPLMAAAFVNPHPEAIILLVGAGADANERFSGKETTPLMAAIEFNENTEVIQALIRAGADVNAADSYGFTPLFHAIWKRGWDGSILEMLVVAGADVNAKDIFGYTVLMNAALANRSPEVFSLLLARGADVNAVADNGVTALLWALASSDDPEVIRLLLDAGADASAKLDDGKNAMDLALDNEELRDSEVIFLLKSYR